MPNLISAFPLYNFLKYCNTNPNEKIILDCGAGGSNPPLYLFYEFGYETYGIELSEEQLKKASVFCSNHNVDLNIIHGDMKKLPFSDEFFSFLFSYNTSVHMRKEDFLVSLSEFYRLTGYDEHGLQTQIEKEVDFETFFAVGLTNWLTNWQKANRWRRF